MSAKRHKKFNIIDAAVIIVLLILAAVLVYAALSQLGVGTSGKTVRYVLETDILSSDYASKVAVGDGVYTYDGVQNIGTVSAVSLSPARHTGTDAEGNPVSSEIDGYSVLYITVEAKMLSTPSGYAVGDTVVNVGRDLELRFPSLYCNAQCVSIEEVTED